jgi:hypothetical protein
MLSHTISRILTSKFERRVYINACRPTSGNTLFSKNDLTGR